MFIQTSTRYWPTLMFRTFQYIISDTCTLVNATYWKLGKGYHGTCKMLATSRWRVCKTLCYPSHPLCVSRRQCHSHALAHTYYPDLHYKGRILWKQNNYSFGLNILNLQPVAVEYFSKNFRMNNCIATGIFIRPSPDFLARVQDTSIHRPVYNHKIQI